MTPALPRIKGHGGRASRGWWGNLSRRSRLLESRLEWGWTTVLLHRTTRSVLISFVVKHQKEEIQSDLNSPFLLIVIAYCMSNELNIFCISLYCSSCLWLWRSVVSWWRRGGWSTQASTESQETTLQSPTCRRSSITRAWLISISRMMWVSLNRSMLL